MDDNGSAHSSMFGDLSTEEVTSKIILTAIIILFMALLFFLILHLYAKLYWWRIDQLQQQQQQQQQNQEQEDQSSTAPAVITRRQRRRFIFVPGQDALSTNTGLTSFELSSLPIVLFRQDSCKDGLECSICLSELVKGDKARLLPKCNHCFHVECIDMWFQSHSTCPICRNTVLGPEKASSKRVEQVQDNAVATSTNNNNDALSPISTSSPEFPTNVLVWGRQDQVSTRNTNVGSQEDGASNAASQSQEAVVLDINDSSIRIQNVSSSSSSSMRYIVEEEEAKSSMTTRLRSLRRFLSRDKRVAYSSSSSTSSSSNAVASVDP